MTKVGQKSNRAYSPKLMRTIFWAGIVIIIFAAAYSAFIYFSDARPPSPFFNKSNLIIATLIFILTTIVQSLIRPNHRISLTISIALTYLTGTFYMLTVIGDAPAVYIFSIVLLITTEVFFGFRWFVIGAIYFTVVMTVFGLLYPDPTGGRLVSIVISTALTLGTVGMLTWLKSSGLIRIEAYEQLKSREKLQTERISTIINSIDNAIINVDTDGRVQLYNSATLSLLDTNSALSGQSIDRIFHLVDEEGNKISLSKLSRGVDTPITREDLRHVFKNGEKINLMLDLAPVRTSFNQTSNTSGTIIIARDITKQKSLDDERDEFISVVSHELRTPVAIAEGALSNLQFLFSKSADPKTMLSTLDAAHDQILYLGQMVNDLSTLSRAQRGTYMDAENINIKDFMNELYNKYLPQFRQQELTLDLDVRTSGTIKVARMAIEEIMQNLITNAMKYTSKGGVTISAHNVQLDGQPGVEFAVRDTGIGISQSDQKHVAERFWRSEDYRTRETSGTGLGLYVTWQLAEKIGTHIDIKSRINYGSVFSFRLPLK